jgi:hypothetical protein
MTSGAIGAATNRASDSFRGTIFQAVVVNGVPVIPGNTPVNLQVVASDDGLTVRLTGITINGKAVEASSSKVALDPQTAAGNAAIEHAIAAASAARRAPTALEGRLVVISGPKMNLPSGARLLFTLSAPITIDGAAPVGAPDVRRTR